MMSLYKIDVFFINYITLICIIYTNPHHFTPCILFYTPQQAILYTHYIAIKLRHYVYLISQYFRKSVFKFTEVSDSARPC